MLVCIERETLRVCVCWRCKFALLEALLEPWRSFEELWRSFEDSEAIWSLEVHKSWIGALWRYFEALDVQSSIVSLD